MKFLNDQDETFDPKKKKSLAMILGKRSNVPETEMASWWKDNYKHVITAFNSRRNYLTNCLKDAFLGE